MSKIILHICGGEKFIQPFIDLLAKSGIRSEHYFFIAEKNPKYKINCAPNVFFLGSYRWKFVGALALAWKMLRADSIVVHGLFGDVLYILLLLPWTLKKVHWVIWGGDLYVHVAHKRTVRWHIDELVRRLIIPRIGFMQSWIDGDFDLASVWYGAKGKRLPSLMYLSNVFEQVAEECVLKRESITVLVGNSADPSNNHEEIFALLKKVDDQKMRVVCPLAYGDEEHAQKIVELGREYFAERFDPLRQFTDIGVYNKKLAEIDIAIFAHKRQQGMGNTITLLGLGKKVYMRPEVTPWKTFSELGIVLYPLKEISLEPIQKNIAESNKAIIRKEFSKEKLVTQLKSIFDPDSSPSSSGCRHDDEK